MAKRYSVVPGGRVDNATQAVKRIGNEAMKSAAGAGLAGMIMGGNAGPANAIGAGALFGGLGGAAGAVGQTVKEVRQHRALRREQFNK